MSVVVPIEMAARILTCRNREAASMVYLDVLRDLDRNQAHGVVSAVNDAILGRWSKSALRYIKRRAWALWKLEKTAAALKSASRGDAT